MNWKKLCWLVAEINRLTKKERKRMYESPTAELIGMLPFIAKTEEPEREAIANLTIFIVAQRTPYSYYNPGSDSERLETRLRHFCNFRGGDRKVIKNGMANLCLMMLEDYCVDQERDKSAGKPNPITLRMIDYEMEKSKLKSVISATATKEINEIVKKQTQSFWQT